MKYYLRVFCQKSTPVSPEEVIGFIKDGFFFEQNPQITLQKENDLNWEIKIVYDREREPVIISTRPDDKESKKEIEEIKFVLDISKESKKKEMISGLVNSTNAVYTLQINQDEITDDCWEMLDSVEAMLMRLCNGILFTSDNEFFDQKLQKIYKL
ncbi:MAG: hypothetical protein FIB07_03790 [Candidatus Methanoperedens sp.]|nr:hypothetical protein [Candidatus Methanoperedens sp.]